MKFDKEEGKGIKFLSQVCHENMNGLRVHYSLFLRLEYGRFHAPEISDILSDVANCKCLYFSYMPLL